MVANGLLIVLAVLLPIIYLLSIILNLYIDREQSRADQVANSMSLSGSEYLGFNLQEQGKTIPVNVIDKFGKERYSQGSIFLTKEHLQNISYNSVVSAGWNLELANIHRDNKFKAAIIDTLNTVNFWLNLIGTTIFLFGFVFDQYIVAVIGITIFYLNLLLIIGNVIIQQEIVSDSIDKIRKFDFEEDEFNEIAKLLFLMSLRPTFKIYQFIVAVIRFLDLPFLAKTNT